MSAFDDIKINTPGGTLYTGGTTTVTGTTSTTTVSGTIPSSSDCQTCLNSILITNLGGGHPLYQGKGTYNVFNFRSIVAGTGTTITHDDKTITIGIDTSGISIDGATTLQALTDVSIDETKLTTGQVLTWNGTKWDAETSTGSGSTGASNLSNLLDVSVDKTKLTTGQALVWNGTKWVAETIQTGGGTSDVKNLTDLADVSVTSPTEGQVLTYHGTKWEAKTPAASGGTTAPNGTSPMYIFHLPIKVAAGVAGVTGFGNLPEGWTATVTEPSTHQYNVTVTHNTGLMPIALVSTVQNVLTPKVNNNMILSTNTASTAYLLSAPDTNKFIIYNCGASQIKVQPNPTVDQTAVLHIMMA